MNAIKNIFLIGFLIGGVYFVANYGGIIKSQAMVLVGLDEETVKGASTKKAEEVTGKLGKDVEKQLDTAADQALNMRVSDALTTISRLQQIPKDFNNVQEYVKGQVNNVLQSREQKVKEEKNNK